MKKTWKARAASFLLVLVMMLAIVPLSALSVFAEGAEITEVSTWAELLNAVNSDKTYIKLMNTIKDEVPDDELPTKHRLLFNGGVDYVLDLNGYQLGVYNYANEFYTGNFSMIGVSNGSDLEIKGGSITFNNWYSGHERTAKGVIFVDDTSTLTATRVDMSTDYLGTVVYAAGEAEVMLNGGDYTAMNGFALYLTGAASLTLDGGVFVGTEVGDSVATIFLDGYGALYSESTGTLTVNNAYFNTGIQVNETQIGAFDADTHELIINGVKQTEDVYLSVAGNQFSALEAGKEYYWYKNGHSHCLYKVESPLFANTVSVISYEKKYPIEVTDGVAKIGGVAVTEASYGQEVTVIANDPEAGMEFVRWDTNGVEPENYYGTTTTFKMPAAPAVLAAFYGKESISSVSVSVGDLVVGQKAYETEITVGGSVELQLVEWYEDYVLMEENAIFQPGKAYELHVLVCPPDEHKFADAVTATVNGNAVSPISKGTGHMTLGHTFAALAANPFPVLYNTLTAQLGIGGKLELDTALMSSQSAEFKAALDAGTATYQWYKDGDAIEGATNPVYVFGANDVDSLFYVTVTAGGKTAWGTGHKCYNYLYQIYLNASETVPGGRAPVVTSASPVFAVDPETVYLTNGDGSVQLDMEKTVLVPGKTYRLVGQLVAADEVQIPYGANVHVNGELMEDKVDATNQFFYKFTVSATDFPVYYKTNGDVGIGVTLTVDTQKMCDENGTFKHALEAANPTYQTVFYQWYKNGAAIGGATGDSYTVKITDKNSYIHCEVSLVDGKRGIGEQHIITNVITVLTVTMPIPKNGQTRIQSNDVTVNEAIASNIMWWPKEAPDAIMQGSDLYVEGTVYECYIRFSPKDGFVFADAAQRTVYIYGAKASHASGYAYGGEVTAIHVHQYSDTVWAYDEEGCHWQPCIIPGCTNPNEEMVMYADHWGGGATCQQTGICGQCGKEYLGYHDFSVPDYQYVDDMRCANFCEYCDVWVDWGYHEGGVTTCQQKAICEFCHHEYGDTLPHSGGTATCTAKAVCTACGTQYGDLAPHAGGTATCTAKAVCIACGAEYGDLVPHAHGTAWKTDATNHWNECICGDKANTAAHADGNGDGKCDACAYTLSVTTPDAQSPSTEPTDGDGGLSGGAVAGIVIGSVTVVGVGGFAIFWFVIKKKKFADLIAVFKKKG